MKKQAVVIHSGGMDSSICLFLAKKVYGKDRILSLSFAYRQRHQNEIIQAAKICYDWGVEHRIIPLDFFGALTSNALMNKEMVIDYSDKVANTLVVGRNGLMARIGAIVAEQVGADCIYMGVIGLEAANSGYRDCSRHYMDLKQEILRIDLDRPSFEIRTPLVDMTKKETLKLAKELGILEYLLEETITCYEGIPKSGCEKCPACLLRNQGLLEFSNAF